MRDGEIKVYHKNGTDYDVYWKFDGFCFTYSAYKGKDGIIYKSSSRRISSRAYNNVLRAEQNRRARS